jgi:hypothetical protein
MALKPWYKVVTPREDLREGKPLDASEFAVHLDQIRDGRAPDDYQKPEQFFDRTYLTVNLTSLAAEVIRRLSGEKTETSAVFNLATQFGGGKTHALTLLYHLAKHGPESNNWLGVRKLLDRAGMPNVPKAATAVFVGTEFDSISGRGGDDGTPLRRTPWGEIAYQLGGESALAVVTDHDKQMTAPAGDVIRKFLPSDGPCLILIDELMNYISRTRKTGMAAQVYNFLQSLSEEVRGRSNTVLAVSIPASEMEMSGEDQADHERLKKLLDRLGKAVIMSAESETSEIIRRRLFEWESQSVTQDGKVMLSRDAIQTCNEYADWVIEHRQQVPALFNIDNARQVFASTYPFHPMVFSVFERKWQSLPRFQRTRGVLRLLALWVSRAYQEGFKGAHKDPLIGLGTAPLDDALCRAAVFEQVGEPRLEIAVTTDICGKGDSHAIRLDKEAVDSIKKARLHRKAATAVFFESNGGQARGEATVPEIRLAVAEPDIDIGNIETVLETLGSTSYYLSVERNKYRFSLSPNLNKLLADRRASIQPKLVEERARAEVLEIFKKKVPGIELIAFPEKSSQIPDRPVVTFVVLSPEFSMLNERTLPLIESMTRESGTSSRTFKSGVVWCVADNATPLQEEARKILAWEDIELEESKRLDEVQRRQLAESLGKAKRDLTESVWRTYKTVILLGKDNVNRVIDLGLVHSSAASSLVALIVSRLQQDGDIEDNISPNFLVRNWPPAFKEWSTKSVRDAFFASPQFPRLLNPLAIKDTIARGVSGCQMAYVGKSGTDYDPFWYNKSIGANEVEISEDVYIVTKETADEYNQAKIQPLPPEQPHQPRVEPPVPKPPFVGEEEDGRDGPGVTTNLKWEGEVPAQKWMTFYNKVLSKYSVGSGLKIRVAIEANSDAGISSQKVDETKVALRELGLDDDLTIN